MRPWLLAGYFGFGNAGDELIRRVVEGALAPALCRALPPRRGPLAALRALRGCGGLILAGGELFQSRTSLRSLLYYLFLVRLAGLLRLPVHAHAVGADPDMTPLQRRLVRWALAGLRSWTARDEASAETLGRGPRFFGVVPDPVWAWPAVPAPRPAPPRRVLWVLRLEGEGDVNVWARRLEGIEGWEHGFMALHPGRDLAALGRLRARLGFFHGLETWAEPGEAAERIKDYGLVVSMRYHGLLLAVLVGRPVLAVAAHPKVAALARALSIPCLSSEDVSIDALRRALSAAAAAPPPDAAPLRDGAESALRALAGRLAAAGGSPSPS